MTQFGRLCLPLRNWLAIRRELLNAVDAALWAAIRLLLQTASERVVLMQIARANETTARNGRNLPDSMATKQHGSR